MDGIKTVAIVSAANIITRFFSALVRLRRIDDRNVLSIAVVNDANGITRRMASFLRAEGSDEVRWLPNTSSTVLEAASDAALLSMPCARKCCLAECQATTSVTRCDLATIANDSLTIGAAMRRLEA